MNIFFCDSFEIYALLICPFNDLVIDVCKVSNKSDPISTVLQGAADRIEDDGRPGMADVAEVVDCNPSNIHPHPFVMEWNKILFLSGQRVVDAKGH